MRLTPVVYEVKRTIPPLLTLAKQSCSEGGKRRWERQVPTGQRRSHADGRVPAICATPPPGGPAARVILEAAGSGSRRQLPRASKSRADPENPCTTLTPRGRGALRSQGSRAHKRSPRSFQLEPAKKSATSALRCRHHKAKTLTFCLLFIQLLRL